MPRTSVALLLLFHAFLFFFAAADFDSTTTHVVILSDRYLGTVVVMNSTCTSAADASSLAFHVITGREGAQVLPALWEQIAPCAAARLTVETVEEATNALTQRGFSPFWIHAAASEGEWGVRTPYTDDKHAAPLNHLRFFLPHLPALEGVDRFLFLDDDIVVQRDVTELRRSYELGPAKAMAAGCQHWTWTKEGFVTSYDTSMLETGYLGAVGTSCADADAALAAMEDAPEETDARATRRWARLQKKREQATKSCVRDGLLDELRDVDSEIHGAGGAAKLRGGGGGGGEARSHPLERTAFNMGFNLIDTAAWNDLRLTERYESWVAASTAQKLFPPNTLAFGLVLAYLALGDAVQCYDDEVTHLVGLSFIPQERLEGTYGWTAQRMVDDAFALHYNGKNKPWDAPLPPCAEAPARPESALDIWQAQCGKFCPCVTTTTGADMTTGRGGGRRLLQIPNEYVPNVDGDDGPASPLQTSAGPQLQTSWGLLASLLAVQTTRAWSQCK